MLSWAVAEWTLGEPEARMYNEFVSPYGYGRGAPMLRDLYPFVPRMSANFEAEAALTKEDTDVGFAPALNLNVGIDNVTSLRLNINRMSIKKAGYSCGIPGSGVVDPFELGNKYVMPAKKKVKHRRTAKEFPAATRMASELLEARELKKRDTLQNRGKVSRANEFCWQVKIRIDLANGTTKLCGGTIIGSKTILTAAHCVVDRTLKKPFRPSTVTVQVGQDSPNSEELQCVEIYLAEFILPHPSYDIGLEDNDIALVVLNSEIKLAEKDCACKLCIKDKEPQIGQSCVVAGDGRTREINGGDITAAEPMKWFKQKVLRQTFDSHCAFILDSGKFTDLDAFICAGDEEAESSCQGDDGSAFVCFDQQSDTHYAAGIVSFGAGCGKDIGSQYTKLRPYLQWIGDNSPAQNVHVQRGWMHEIARSLDENKHRLVKN
ncbi:serine protease 55-like isoform X2 [Paramacrobiotus metropolitanus]|uniref:serine protease 55-like isoform X2 n=1 Tax=Paramacrobiotus metropolitanus TaxID=2943436 RepID=UPI0024460462|nr:serine protease 55-like isoform X2 [Paramacrobiotus metropolitanus]